MNKVTTVNLAGNAYQVEEAGYERLRAYLDAARATLAGNPDVDEIIRDLEAAIAEKLSRSMGPHASVASSEEVEIALKEMGPVDGASEEAGTAKEAAEGAGPKRLYVLPNQAVICGVCAGIAAYFDIDPTVMRLIFVAATILTGGGWILLYFLMTVFVPYAKTPREEAQAAGKPFNAEEVMQHAREGWTQLKKSGQEWKRYAHEEKRKRTEEARRWRRQGRAWQDYRYYSYKRTPTLAEELVHVAIVALIIWAIYTFIPGTQPFFNHLWALFVQGWTWIFGKLAH